MSPTPSGSAFGGFPWPMPPDWPAAPRWTGTGFAAVSATGAPGRQARVLNFTVGDSGWTDDLSFLHEDTAGGGHFIDVASRRRALDALARYLPSWPGGEPVVLEVGCSSGYFLRDLQAALPGVRVVGADYTGGTLERLGTAMPDVPLLRFDLTRCPLPDACLDGVVLLNVLEHIEDDGRALAEIRRILRPGGIAVIEVPAGPGLYDAYDHFLMHHRRYSMNGLLAQAAAAGLEPVERSHLGFLLYPAFALSKLLSRRRGIPADSERERYLSAAISGSGEGRMGGLGHALMAAEAWLGRRVPLPVGIRCTLTARRPL